MAFPAGGNKLQLVAHQDSDGALVETYTIPAAPYQHQLGTGTIPSFPVLPTGWQLLVKGAFPLPAPAAPTALATVSGAGNFLTPSTLYKWVVTHETDYGETVAGSILPVTIGAGSGGAGYHMTLPALNGTASNPVRRRRLWRTIAGGTGSFFLVDEFGTERLDYVDGRADSSLDTSTTAPVVNTSGATAITSLKINGVEKVSNEVVSAPGVAGAWSCDYTYGPSAGQITHAAADVGLVVIVTYTAALELNAQLFLDLITAIKEIDTAAGTASGLADLDAGGHVPLARLSGLTSAAMAGAGTSGGFGGVSGFATLDASSHVIQAAAVNPVTTGAASGVASLDGSTVLAIAQARGVKQAVVALQTNDVVFNSVTTVAYPGTFTPALSATTTTATSRLRVRLTVSYLNQASGSPVNMRFYATINGVQYALGGVGVVSGNATTFAGVCLSAALAAGVYTVTLQYDNGSAIGVGLSASTDPTHQRAVCEIEEIQ